MRKIPAHAVLQKLDGLDWREGIASLIGGSIAGLFSVIYCSSFAALIFSGPLAAYLPVGMGLTLLTGAVVSGMVTSLSSFPAMVAVPPKTTAAVLALLASSIATSMAAAPPQETFLTVVAAIILTSVISGIALITLGWFRLGQLIRYIPYPVIGGFMAGSGWLLVEGALRLMTGISVRLVNLPQQLPLLFDTQHFMLWWPGLQFALLLLIVLPQHRHFLVLPGLIGGAIALFYGTLTLKGMSLVQIGQAGLLLGPFPQGTLWQFVSVSALTQAHWSIVWGQLGNVATLCLINAISLLLNATGIELATEQDMDLNRELKVAGIATVASAVGGGIGGFQSLSQTMLAYRLGARTRFVGWVVASICALVLVLGAAVLSIIPKVVIGGMILYLGLELMLQWLYGGWFRLSRADYGIVVLILLVVAAVGYLEGIGVGVLAASVLFVISYSQLDVTRRDLSGANYHSNVLRTPAEERLLAREGDQIYILELQGLIFFGVANKLLVEIRDRLDNPQQGPVRFVVLDFRLCNGFDASAVLSFVKLQQITRRQQIQLILTHLAPQNLQQLQQGGMRIAASDRCYVFADLDLGLEWCERLLLEQVTSPPPVQSLAEQLEAFLPELTDRQRLLQYLEPCFLEAGQALFRQGDPYDGLYFVESGRVSVFLELPEGSSKRIRSFIGGSTIGEMGVYCEAPRSASVVADQPSSLYFLSVVAFAALEREAPLIAIQFHKFVVRSLSERLNHREKELKSLLQ